MQTLGVSDKHGSKSCRSLHHNKTCIMLNCISRSWFTYNNNNNSNNNVSTAQNKLSPGALTADQTDMPLVFRQKSAEKQMQNEC